VRLCTYWFCKPIIIFLFIVNKITGSYQFSFPIRKTMKFHLTAPTLPIAFVGVLVILTEKLEPMKLFIAIAFVAVVFGEISPNGIDQT
jgi:hypothetical protein